MWGVINASENVHISMTQECKSGTVASLVYMIRDRDDDINVDTYKILLLLADWDAEYFMDAPSTLHIRGSYALKS